MRHQRDCYSEPPWGCMLVQNKKLLLRKRDDNITIYVVDFDKEKNKRMLEYSIM